MNATSPARWHVLGGALALIAAIALTGLLASSDTAHAQATFNPASTLGVSDPTPGANADIISTFNIAAPDVQFGATANFTPPEWGIGIDANVPDGAISAKLTSTATLGVIGGGCRTTVGVNFDMLDSTTNQSTLITFNDPEFEAEPTPDSNDSQGAEPDDQFDIGPDGLPLGVTRYPDYLTRIFRDPQGTTLQPISRLYGQAEVAGIEVSLNFVLFEPGTVFETPAGDTVATDPRLGYVSATVLQAAGDPATDANVADNNAVSDFCSPLDVKTTVFGVSQDNPNTAANEAGAVLRTNPPAGTYNFVTFATSQRDADGDGMENGLDVCVTTPNPEYDPRDTAQAGQTGDADGDRLPTACDPDDNVASPISGGVHDEDRDQYGNRGDNCPLIANSQGQPGGSGPDNQLDTDSDGIGDACDPNPTTPDGERFQVCLVAPVDVGGGGTPPDPAPTAMLPCDPNASPPGPGELTPTPTNGTPTLTPSTTPTVGPDRSPDDGVGALAPTFSGIPAWAAIASGLGGAGLLGTLGTFAARLFGVRPSKRRDE